MRPFQFLTALLFAFNSAFVSAKPAEKAKTPAELAAMTLNAVEGVYRLYAFMQIGASEEDQKFIETLRVNTKDAHLPKASAKDNELWLQGLEKPLVAVDIKKGVFSYNGRSLTLDWSKGFKANYELMEKTVRPKGVALLGWILPQAHADLDLSTMLPSLLVGGGVMAGFMGDSTTTKTLGFGAALLGGIMLLTNNNNNKPKYPRYIDCTAGGMREVLVRGANGQIYRTIAGYGAPYQINPALGAAYNPYGQFAASNVTGMCNSPMQMAQANYALSLPPYYPAPSLAPATAATGIVPQAWPTQKATTAK